VLDFVERLVDWSTGLSILVLCSARPELYDLRSGWGGGKRNSNTVSLSPLTREDTARLVAALLESAVLPAETQEALLERAGGNPLYTEEYVRMFLERGSAEELPLPDTVQGIIAARLDSLPSERKALLHDASVIGKVFWAGALEAMASRSPVEVREGLHQLALRELVRPARTSSVEGQAEYLFWHALIRDVAYGQIPRASRAARHRAAADWIEGMAGDRLADHAELLAYHVTEAISLARAAGDERDAELESRAARFLVLAGDRSSDLDVQRAEKLYRRALGYLPAGSVEHARVLVKAAEATRLTGRVEAAARDLEEAAATLEAHGDARGAGAALTDLQRVYFSLGGGERMERTALQALVLLEVLPPSPELVTAYGRMAVVQAFRGHRPEEAIEWAEKAIELGERLGLRRELLSPRQWRGLMRCELGDLDGMADLEESLHEAIDLEASGSVVAAYVNVADHVWRQRGPDAARAVQDEAVAYVERRGITSHWVRAESCWMLYDLGDWDELLRAAEGVRTFSEEHGKGQPDCIAATYLAHVFVRRGATDAAATVMDEALPHALQIEDPQVLGPALVASALVAEARGDLVSACARIVEYDDATRDRPFFRTQNLSDAARIACAAGDVALAESLRDGAVTAAARDRLSDDTARAAILEAGGDPAGALAVYDEVARGWQEFRCVLEHGLALLAGARCLVADGRPGEATGPLEEARQIFTRLDARPLLSSVERILGSQPSATTG